ncbi:MAG: PqqD family protein [Candidatus Omnitrophica bacterium]|nr:PqqD family protein [Candidatus Omnitrophota bacterium]
MGILNKCYDKDPQVVFREVAGEMILVPVRNNAADLESIYTFNELGGRIWGLINGKRTLDDIKTILLGEFETQEEELNRDINGFFSEMENLGLVREKK